MSRRLPRSDRAYLGDILDACQKLMSLSAGTNSEAFSENWVTHHAAFSLLELVGEASGRPSQDFRDQYTSIPWAAMRGMRNVLIHGYADVQLEAVWETLERDIPELHRQISTLLREE